MIRINSVKTESRYGIYYFIDICLLKIGIKKKLSYKAILEKQRYFKKLPLQAYPKELTRWYEWAAGKKLDLNHPRTFTEKVQWLKLFDSTPQKTLLADKYCVREWIKEMIGEEYLIPLLGMWESSQSIDFTQLPDSFVIKCNHGCAMNILIEDKKKVNLEAVRRQLSKWMSINYAFMEGDFQMHYRDIKPRIIAEAYMKDEEEQCLQDYKFYCFNGIPSYCQVISNRTTEETIDFYNMDWELQNFTGLALCKNSKNGCKKPHCFNEMKQIAEKLSKDFAFVRVDLYEINNRIYFGEMTFTPGSGGGRFTPDSADLLLGQMLKLPIKKSGDYNE